MNWLRATAVALSIVIHASIGYAMLPSLQKSSSEALDIGKGTDVVLVEQGIATEGQAKLGDAMETIETAEIVPVQELPPPPPQETKPDELKDVIASQASEVEQQVVKSQDPPPVTPPPPPPREVLKQQAQPQQVAIVTEQSSGEQKSGGDAKALGVYLGRVNNNVQKAKINPRSRIEGTVLMKFTIGIDGALLSKEVASSSGSKVLDDAAIAALDRAAPFPPIPPEVSAKPIAFTQPFHFIIR